MEDDTNMEGGAERQSATATPSCTLAEVHGAAWPGRVPHAPPSPVPDGTGDRGACGIRPLECM